MENKLIKIFICLAILLIGLTNNAQSMHDTGLINYKKNSYYLTNFNGPIKSSHWYYTYVKDSIPFAVSKDSLTQTRARNNIMLQNRTILGFAVYSKFDTVGRLQESINGGINRSYFGKSEPNYQTGSTYLYNDEDWKSKNEIKIKRKQIYPVHDYDILIKTNIYSKLGGSVNIHKRMWDYILDQDIIKRERYYHRVITGFNEIEELNEDILKKHNMTVEKTDKLPYTESEYIYDKRNNIKQINIRSKQERERPIPFHFLGTEVNFCPDLHVSYEYDNKDRITQVTYYGCRDTLAFEKYTYHTEKNYITERIRYIKSDLRGVEHRTKTMIFYHNENGDIIEKRFVKDQPTKPFYYHKIFLPESIYYTYEYDEYNNWVKCYIYMEGKPEESDPTAIAQRDIEYYDS